MCYIVAVKVLNKATTPKAHSEEEARAMQASAEKMDFDEYDNVWKREPFEVDAGWDWNNVSCPVFAVAVQAEGFDNAAAAMDAAFGTNYNPWGTPATNWQ